MSEGIVVLGMHRSGTSLLAEVLHQWGAFGRTEECLPSDKWNAHGYWELSPLVNFNERLLRAVGATWNFPPSPTEDVRLVELSQQPEYRAQAMELLASMKTARDRNWFWKDPRLSLLLPFWRNVWGEVRYVICVRDPLEICRSLQTRDDLSFSVSILLWQRYMLSILEWTRNLPAIVVGYSAILQNPAAECARLSRFLQRSRKSGNSPRAPLEMIKAVDRELRHHRSAGAIADMALTNGQKELHKTLERMAMRGTAAENLNLRRCSLPRTWRSSLWVNLLLRRCQRRWNSGFSNLMPACDDAALLGAQPANNFGLSKEDLLCLAISKWSQW